MELAGDQKYNNNVDEIPNWASWVGESLLKALGEKDPYTYEHSHRVARYACLLAKAAGLSEFHQRVIKYSSIFHDLGKMGVPDSILLKPGRLNAEEEAIMRDHPLKSAEIIQPLAHLPFFAALLPGIRHHHERVDGAGYPDGLQRDNIPIEARMILIADTFDAMTSSRPYRKGLVHEIAYNELKRCSGSQFDSNLVEIFLEAHRASEAAETSIPVRKAA